MKMKLKEKQLMKKVKLTENPLESINTAMCFYPGDWNGHHRLAWIYGIAVGWDDSLDDVANDNGWDRETVVRLKRLRRRWVELENGEVK